MRCFCFFVLILSSLCLGFTPSIKAQENYEGNVIYSRNRDSQRELVFYHTNQVTALPENHCIRYSPHLDFMAIVDPNTFEQLRFVNLANGQESYLAWQSTWNLNCTVLWNNGMDWFNNEILSVTSLSNFDEIYSVNLITKSISGPFPEPDNPQLPLYAPEYNIRAYSPNRSYVIYRRCEEVECYNTQFAIYNLAHEEFISWLDGHGYMLLHPVSSSAENLFSWSHREQYLSYFSVEDGISIYDVVHHEILSLNFLPRNMNQVIIRGVYGWKWSPDDSQVAFWVSNLDTLDYSFDEGLAIVNLRDETFRVLDVPSSSWPRSLDDWGWSPTGDSLLLVQNDDNLYELNLETHSQTLIDSEVDRIHFWYSGEEN